MYGQEEGRGTDPKPAPVGTADSSTVEVVYYVSGEDPGSRVSCPRRKLLLDGRGGGLKKEDQVRRQRGDGDKK